MDIKKLAPWNWFKKEEKEVSPEKTGSIDSGGRIYYFTL